MLPPKGADPRTLRRFPCKQAVFREPPEVTMIAILDPLANRRRIRASSSRAGLDDGLLARPAFFLLLSVAKQVKPLPRRIAPVRLEQHVPPQDDLRALGQSDTALLASAAVGTTEHDPVEQTVQETASL